MTPTRSQATIHQFVAGGVDAVLGDPQAEHDADRDDHRQRLRARSHRCSWPCRPFRWPASSRCPLIRTPPCRRYDGWCPGRMVLGSRLLPVDGSGHRRDRDVTVASCARGGATAHDRCRNTQPRPTRGETNVHHTNGRASPALRPPPSWPSRQRSSPTPATIDPQPRSAAHRPRRAARSRPTRPARRPARSSADVVTNGVHVPAPSQPVEGFSGIVDGRRPGEYLAMPDNGFGDKANSVDFLIRAYYITPDFKTATRRNAASVAVGDFISFRDPDGVIGFPIVNEATRRTPADRRRHRPGVDPARPARRPLDRRRVRAVDPALRRTTGVCSSRRSRCPTD